MCLLEKEQVILEQKLLQTLTRVVLIGSQSDLYEVGPTGIFLGHCGCVLEGNCGFLAHPLLFCTLAMGRELCFATYFPYDALFYHRTR